LPFSAGRTWGLTAGRGLAAVCPSGGAVLPARGCEPGRPVRSRGYRNVAAGPARARGGGGRLARLARGRCVRMLRRARTTSLAALPPRGKGARRWSSGTGRRVTSTGACACWPRCTAATGTRWPGPAARPPGWPAPARSRRGWPPRTGAWWGTPAGGAAARPTRPGPRWWAACSSRRPRAGAAPGPRCCGTSPGRRGPAGCAPCSTWSPPARRRRSTKARAGGWPAAGTSSGGPHRVTVRRYAAPEW